MSSLSRPYTLGTGTEEREIIQPLLAMEKRLYSEKRSSSEQQFCKPSNANTGKRDRSWEDIEKTINLNCNCSKGDCLKQLKDGHDYSRAHEVLGDLRFRIHQNGANNPKQQKEELRSAFKDTVKGQSEFGVINHDFRIDDVEVFCSSYRCHYSIFIISSLFSSGMQNGMG